MWGERPPSRGQNGTGGMQSTPELGRASVADRHALLRGLAVAVPAAKGETIAQQEENKKGVQRGDEKTKHAPSILPPIAGALPRVAESKEQRVQP